MHKFRNYKIASSIVMRFTVSTIIVFIVTYIRPAAFAEFLHLLIVSKEHVMGFYIFKTLYFQNFIIFYFKACIMYKMYKVNIREKGFLS